MKTPIRRRLIAGAIGAVLVVAAPALAGCGGGSGRSITIYNAQHKQLLEEFAPIFEEETGIKVKLRNGTDYQIANQLVKEGDRSPADVFLTENSPAMSIVDAADLFDPLSAELRKPIPAEFAPSDGDWVGFVARSTVLVYNTDKVKEADLPKSLMDLSAPEWKGRISFAPNGADFQAIVSAVLELKGEAATKEWLAGLKANGKPLGGNNVVLKAVNSGDVDAGIIYHYYWSRDQNEAKEFSANTNLLYFGKQDPGAFVSVSGAGVLKSSKHKEDALKFIEFLVSEKGQKALADSYALEYPLNPKVELGHGVKPFAELDHPKIEIDKLNGPDVIKLMTEAGFL